MILQNANTFIQKAQALENLHVNQNQSRLLIINYGYNNKNVYNYLLLRLLTEENLKLSAENEQLRLELGESVPLADMEKEIKTVRYKD